MGNHFSQVKKTKLIYLCPSIALELWLDTHFNHPNSPEGTQHSKPLTSLVGNSMCDLVG